MIEGIFSRVFTGVPHVSPPAAALFRIALAGALVVVLGVDDSIGRPDVSPTVYTPGSGYGTGSWAVAHWVRGQPEVHAGLMAAAIALAVAFGIGLFTRLTAALLCLCLFLLVSASLVTVGNHAWGAPLLALTGLVLSPLGEAWSVDAWWRGRRGHAPVAAPGPRFGFAMWWIGLVLGSALLGAAATKLSTSGLEWITGGAIRFHFVEDAGNAVVPWGLWIAGRDWLSIAVSAAAILFEATLILNVLRRSDGYRAVFGLAGLSLHLGFFLFQGVLWWPWVMLYIAFLPWQAISRALAAHQAAPAPPQRLTAVPAIAAAGVVMLQAYAVYQQREFEPLLSHYPMYSGTFTSWDEFFETRRWYKYQRYRFVAGGAAGAQLDLRELVSPADRARLIDALYALHSGKPLDQRVIDSLAGLRARAANRTAEPVEAVDVYVDVQRVNFDAMRIDTPVVGLHAFTLRLSPATLVYTSPAFTATLNARPY